MMAEATAQGAQFILTPEVTNCVSTSTTRQREVLQHEENDASLAGLRALAAELGVWLLIGSLAIKTHDADGRFANRSYMIDPQGQIVARYDKIHMFDVAGHRNRDLSRIQANYRPGSSAVMAETEFGTVGMTICYDMSVSSLIRGAGAGGCAHPDGSGGVFTQSPARRIGNPCCGRGRLKTRLLGPRARPRPARIPKPAERRDIPMVTALLSPPGVRS